MNDLTLGIPQSAANPLVPIITGDAEREEKARLFRAQGLANVDHAVLDWDGFQKKQIAAGKTPPVMDFAETPEIARKSGIVNSYLRIQANGRQFANSEIRGAFRDKIAREQFDGRGIGDDIAFYGEIEKEVRERKEFGDLLQEVETQAVAAALLKAGSDVGLEAKSFDLVREEIKSKPGYRKGMDAAYLRAWNDAQEKIEESVVPYLGPLKQVWESMQSGGSDWYDAYDKVPPDKRDEFLASIALMVRSQPAEQQAGLWAKIVKTNERSWETAAVDILDFAGSAADGYSEMRLGAPGESPDETIARESRKEEDRKRRNFIDDINAIRNEEYDPVKAIGFGEKVATGLVSTMPFLASAAVPYAGTGMVFAQSERMLARDFRRTLTQGADGVAMSDAEATELADTMAPIVAVPYTAIERLQVLGLMGRFPALERVLAASVNKVTNQGIRFAGRTGVTAIAETVQENVQQFLPAMTQELAAQLEPSIPGTVWSNGKDGFLDGYWSETAVTFAVMLPLSVVTGAGGVKMDERARTIKATPDLMLRVLGFPSDSIKRIREAEAQGEYQAQQTIAQETGALDPRGEEAKDATQELAEQVVAQKAARERLTESGLLPRAVQSSQTGEFTLYDTTTGTEIGRGLDWQGAAALAATHAGMREKQDADRIAQVFTAYQAAQVSGDWSKAVGRETETTLDFGTEEFTTTWKARDAAEAQRLKDQEVMHGGTGEVTMQVLGQSRTVGMQSINRVLAGGSILDVFHEEAHGFRRAARAAGTLTWEDELAFAKGVNEFLRGQKVRTYSQGGGNRVQVLNEKGEASNAYLPDDFDSLPLDKQERWVDEFISKIIEAEVVRTRKGGGVRELPAGIVSKNLAALARVIGDRTLGKFRAFIKAFGQHFGITLSRAALIQKGLNDGKLDRANYEGFLAKLMGIDEQLALEQQARDIEAGLMESMEIPPMEGDPFSLAPSGSYRRGGLWYHGGPVELEGGRLKHGGKSGWDSGGIFLTDDSDEGKRYAAGYGRALYRMTLDLDEDEVFNLSDPAHRARVMPIELDDGSGPDFLRNAETSAREGSLDWSAVDPEVLQAAGFKAAILMERPAGFLGKNPVRSVAVFDAAAIGTPEPVSQSEYAEIQRAAMDAANNWETESFSLGRATVTPTASTRVFPGAEGSPSVIGPASFSLGPSYGIPHRPNEEGPRAFDLGEGDMMPADVYDHPEWYSAMEPKIIRETMAQLRKVRGKPDAELTIYRAGPAAEMNPGDWVSLSKEYARTHADSQDPENFKVWQAKAKAKDVRWDMNDLAEFGYFGETSPATDTGISFSIRAFHGTPHKIDPREGFKTEKIGTGAGAQAYGHGLYFAGNKSVGATYERVLSQQSYSGSIDGKPAAKSEAGIFYEIEHLHNGNVDSFIAANRQHWEERISAANQSGNATRAEALREIMEEYNATAEKARGRKLSTKRGGNLYTVTLKVEDEDLLDWDKPLGEKILSQIPTTEKGGFVFPQNLSNETTGANLYGMIAAEIGQKAASEHLLSHGIRGIRYLDGNSRGDGAGSYNYVIFDEADIEIVEENGQPVDLTSFSLSSSRLGALTGDAIARIKDPETRAKAMRKLAAELAGLQAEMEKIETEFGEKRFRESLRKEAAMRQALRQDELEKSGNQPLDAKIQARKEAAEWLKQAVKNQETAYSPRAKILRILATVQAIRSILPHEVRWKIGGEVSAARLTGDKAAFDYVKGRIAKADEVLTDWLLKGYERELLKLIKKSAPKKDKAGQKPSGKIGADAHDIFRTLRDVMSLDAKETDAMASSLETMAADPDITPEQEAHLQLHAGLVRLVGDWKHAGLERRESAVVEATRIFKEGYAEHKIAVLKERERRNDIAAALIQSSGATGDPAKRAAKRRKQEGTKLGRASAIKANLLSLEMAMQEGFGLDSPEVEEIVERERRASYAKTDAIFAAETALDELFAQLAGGSNFKGQKLRAKLQDETGIKWTDWKGREQSISPMMAAKYLMMWRQEDGKRHMTGKLDDQGAPVGDWHWRQADIDAIEKQLTPEAKAVMVHLSDHYAGEWERVNAVFRRMEGMNLPRHKFYAPLDVAQAQAGGGQMVDPNTGGLAGPSLTMGSLKTRSTSAVARPNDEQDALQLFIGHMRQMEHYIAYAELAKDMHLILNRDTVRTSIAETAGPEIQRTLSGFVDFFSLGGVRDASLFQALSRLSNRMIGRFAAFTLVGRVSVLAIQSTQLLAAKSYMPTGAYLVRFAKLMTGQLGWGDALNSEFIQRRKKQGPASIQQMMDALRHASPSRAVDIQRRLGETIIGADALFTAGTYAITYDYHLSIAKKNGEADPEAYAERQAIAATERVAQPTRAGTRSIAELHATNPAMRMLWAFASDSRQKLAVAIFQHADRTPREKARAFISAWLVGGVASAMIRAIIRDLTTGGGDDEEDMDKRIWDLRTLSLKSLSGPIGGLPYFGEAIEAAFYKAAGEYHPGGGTPLDNLADAVPAVKNVFTEWPDDDREIEAMLRDSEKILQAGGLMDERLGAAASFSHIAKDLFGTIKSATDSD